MKIHSLKISELKPYKKNAKLHPASQIEGLAESIKRFGFTQPIVIDLKNTIIIGHGRVEAAKGVGLKEVPCLRLTDLSEKEVRALRLIDNRIAETGWDQEVLGIEMKDFDFNFEPFNISFDDFTLPTEEKEGLTDPDFVPEPPKKPRVKLGDVWQCGKHRLMCGDSTDKVCVETLIGKGFVELCFTSPPYENQREYNGGKELAVDKISKFIHASSKYCNYFAVNLGISRSNSEIVPYWNDYILEANGSGLKLLSWNVWDQGFCGSVGKLTAMFPIAHEFIFVFGKETKKLNLTIENKTAGENHDHSSNRLKSGTREKKSEKTIRNSRELGTVFFSQPQTARTTGNEYDHPARFPVSFPEAYILAMTNEGEFVYDPFGGSGTTMIAAEKTNRSCFMMEIDPSYCDLILKRWEDFSGEKARKV